MTTPTIHTVASQSAGARRAGLVVSGLAALLFAADAASQLLALPPVLGAAGEIGYPADPALWRAIGAVLAVATALYVWRRTSVLGAMLLTGYLGGAIASHVRVGGPIAAPLIASVVLAALAWGGLALRDARARALLVGGLQ